MQIISLPQPIEFEWDKGNWGKIFVKHAILQTEAEQAFFNRRVYWFDELHSSKKEQRYNLLGMTDLEKTLFITFTLRNNKVRIISARPADKKEREIHAKEAQKNS